jgi:hypothetical protein
MRNPYKILVGKVDRKRPLERRRCRWEGNINLGMKKVWLECMDWICLALVNMVMNFQVPLKAANFVTNKATLSLSRRTVPLGVSSYDICFSSHA